MGGEDEGQHPPRQRHLPVEPRHQGADPRDPAQGEAQFSPATSTWRGGISPTCRTNRSEFTRLRRYSLAAVRTRTSRNRIGVLCPIRLSQRPLRRHRCEPRRLGADPRRRGRVRESGSAAALSKGAVGARPSRAAHRSWRYLNADRSPNGAHVVHVEDRPPRSS